MGDLENYQLQIAQCHLCVDAGFLEHANPIFSGSAKAKIYFFGQSPGSVEDKVGRPFSGRAGRTLWGWLCEAGVGDEKFLRENVYFASVTRCYPGKHISGSGDRVPSKREIELCSRWWKGELVLLRPKLIVCIGALAASLLVGNMRLDELVGTRVKLKKELVSEFVLMGYDATNVDVVVLPHPSGRSVWLNDKRHAEKLKFALDLIKKAKADLL